MSDKTGPEHKGLYQYMPSSQELARRAQARAEAERRHPTYPEFDQDEREHTSAMRYIFLGGVEWADENHPAVEALARVEALCQSWEPPDPCEADEEECADCCFIRLIREAMEGDDE